MVTFVTTHPHLIAVMPSLKLFKKDKAKNSPKGSTNSKNANLSAHSKDESILAFRTITTMLSLIQQPSETTKVEPVHIPKAKRKELRVLDSLAALLVRNHEVVTVMTVPSNGNSIQIISVVNLNQSRPALTITPQPGMSLSPWNLEWWLSINPRRTAPIIPEADEDSMQVVDPDTRISQTLSNSMGNPDILLHTYLQTQW